MNKLEKLIRLATSRSQTMSNIDMWKFLHSKNVDEAKEILKKYTNEK